MLTADIVEGIKRMFPHKTVDIIIQPADATEYILSNPAYAQELQERIADAESMPSVSLKDVKTKWASTRNSLLSFFC